MNMMIQSGRKIWKPVAGAIVVVAISLALIPLTGRTQEPAAADNRANGNPNTETRKKEATSILEPTKSTPRKPAIHKPPIPEPLPIELRPYRVKVEVAFASHGALTPERRQLFVDRLARRIDAAYGVCWNVDVEECRWLFPAHRESLDRLSPEFLKAKYGEDNSDKVFLLATRLEGDRLVVAGREWDTRIHTLTHSAQLETREFPLAADIAALLIRELFRPVAEISEVEFEQIGMRLQAGAFLTPDSTATQVVPKDHFLPYVRYKDKEYQVQKVTSLPWTYIRSDEVDGFHIKGRMVSGMRLGLSGKKSKRIERLALAVNPAKRDTTLQLVLRKYPDRVLAAHMVRVVSKVTYKEEARGELLELYSDRNGKVSIPFREDDPLVWIYVRSGKQVLARVPYITGSGIDIELQLPDDSIRLAVEGQIILLRTDLIDTVARRASILHRIRKFSQAGDFKPVDQAKSEIKDLTLMSEFRRRLSNIRNEALARLRANPDRMAERRINKLCDETTGLFERYLDESTLEEAVEEAEELRKLDEQEKKDNERDNLDFAA